MSFPVLLVIVLPILCAIFGFAFGIATAHWRSYLGKHDTYSQPSVTNNSNEVSCLEEITVEVSSPALATVSTLAITSKEQQQQLLSPTPLEEQFNIGLPTPGLAQIRTPIRRQISGDTYNLDSQQAMTPNNMTTPVNKGISASAVAAAAALRPTAYSTTTRHGSPTAHLMGHLVRCASQAIDQIESRSVLHRLTSTDAIAANSHFFAAPSPMPGNFLLSPAAGVADQHTQYFNSNNNTTFSSGADEIHMDEVDLISKLGGGSFGSVYRGAWRGAPVAVKYIRTRTDKADSLGGAIREVVLSKKLTHPNIVQTFSWTVLAQPQVVGEEENEENGNLERSKENYNISTTAEVLDFSRHGSDVSEIAGLSSSFLHRNGSIEEEEEVEEAAAAAAVKEAEELERYSIPAVWNNNIKTSRRNDSNSLLSNQHNGQNQQQKQQLQGTATSSPSSSSSCSLNIRGVKRRRTGLDSATPSPTSLGLDPRMDSFNSEEGFGSPVKKKRKKIFVIF
jgi:Protein kinase domain